MASWSNVIDREKWRLALLGGIEVRRASGNEEAGNGGSGAGGLSKPKWFHFTSMPFPFELREDAVGVGVGMRPSPVLRDRELVGVVGALSAFDGTRIIYTTYRVEGDYVEVTGGLTAFSGTHTVYSTTRMTGDVADVRFTLSNVQVNKILITHAQTEDSRIGCSCALTGVY